MTLYIDEIKVRERERLNDEGTSWCSKYLCKNMSNAHIEVERVFIYYDKDLCR